MRMKTTIMSRFLICTVYQVLLIISGLTNMWPVGCTRSSREIFMALGHLSGFSNII